MSLPIMLVSAAAGLVTGLVFFRLLGSAVAQYLRGGQRLPLLLWAGRMLLVLAVFRMAAYAGMPGLLAALAGFLVARQASLRRVLRSR